MAKAKATVTKLDNDGYDVEFEGGGRVILNGDEASSKADAEKVARERLEASGRLTGTDESDEPAEQPTVASEGTPEAEAADEDGSEDESRDQ